MKTMCFLGDSITRRGYWIAEVFEHLKKEYRIYNCGVSGDSATGAIARLYSDCLCRTPNTVVMMFGMNDIGRGLYDEGCGATEEQKNARITKFGNSLRTLAQNILETGIDLILCTPTPCDEVTPDAPVINHANTGLSRCAAFVRELAQELNVPCVDFFAELCPRLGEEYKTLPDRVHPTPESHHIMAQVFLKTLGFIQELDPTPFLPLNERAQARFDAEQLLREIYFIEWNQMYKDRMSRKMTHADFIVLAEQRLAAAKEAGDARQVSWYSNYLAIVENRTEYESDLVHRTLTF